MDTNLIMNYLTKSKEKVIHRSKIEAILSKSIGLKNIDNILLNLRRLKKIKYIFKGYYYILNSDELANKYYEYSINEMVFVILNKLNMKWYIGLQSSLEFNKLIWQAHSVLIIINNQFSKEITIGGNKIRFRKIKDKYVFGFETKKN